MPLIERYFKFIDKLQDRISLNKVFRFIKDYITIRPPTLFGARELRYPAPIDVCFTYPINVPFVDDDKSPLDGHENEEDNTIRITNFVFSSNSKKQDHWKSIASQSYGVGISPRNHVFEWSLPEGHKYIPVIKQYEDVLPYCNMTKEEYAHFSECSFPNHLPKPWFVSRSAKIIEKYISTNQPPILGERLEYELSRDMLKGRWERQDDD